MSDTGEGQVRDVWCCHRYASSQHVRPFANPRQGVQVPKSLSPDWQRVKTERVTSQDGASAGLGPSPAPAYGGYGDDVQGDPADENAVPSSASPPPGQGRPRRFDRDRGRERSPHITGEAAIRAANEANRAIGAMPDQLALESRHKRYPRP